MSHIDEATLHDYIDGAAGAATQAEVDGHLAACERCRGELAALRRLGRELDALPREISPPRDLRAGIHARIAAGRAERGAGDGAEPPVLPLRGWNAGRSVRTRIVAAAAVVLLVAATATITRLVVLRTAAPPAPAPVATGAARAPDRHDAAAGGDVALARFRESESRYVVAIAEMQRALEGERTQLSPETVRILERNLAVIDRAIRESRAALERDPRNTELGGMILSAYGQKLELLRRAREASS